MNTSNTHFPRCCDNRQLGPSGQQAHQVSPVARAHGDPAGAQGPSGELRLWNPEDPDPSILRCVNVLIHLAGEPIFGRFSAEHKEAICQ